MELLHEILSYDMMSEDSVHDMLMATKRDNVRKNHKYAITPPTTEKGRWQTCYIDSDGKRKNIKAPTEPELLDKLIEVYYGNEHIDKLTFHDLFKEWLEYKKTVSNSMNTIKRHEQHYIKYFANSILHCRKMKLIDTLTLESESNRIVRDNNLPRKEWTNIKTILLGMFDYAVRKKYLVINPMLDVRIQVKFRQVVKKTGRTQTYNSEELEQLNQYLADKYSETDDTAYLAVKFNFLVGLRVGELTALKWSDWEEENQLHVIREEVRDQTKNICLVVEHTKTHNDRFVVLVPKAIEILKRIERTGEYIFMRNGERIRGRQIAYVLEKYAERMNLSTKSTHKMRKTFTSRLASNGVPIDAIRELLGHSNLNTTLGYIYNPLTDNETYDLISKAL